MRLYVAFPTVPRMCLALLVPALSLALLACERTPNAVEPRSGQLTLVPDRAQVCMVNNQFMGRAQIPVEVGGRTYFGCCEMCKGRLAREAATRTALDPLSGREVDKATAVIARDPSGAVVYFESEANFSSYVHKAQ